MSAGMRRERNLWQIEHEEGRPISHNNNHSPFTCAFRSMPVTYTSISSLSSKSNIVTRHRSLSAICDPMLVKSAMGDPQATFLNPETPLPSSFATLVPDSVPIHWNGLSDLLEVVCAMNRHPPVQ